MKRYRGYFSDGFTPVSKATQRPFKWVWRYQNTYGFSHCYDTAVMNGVREVNQAAPSKEYKIRRGQLTVIPAHEVKK